MGKMLLSAFILGLLAASPVVADDANFDAKDDLVEGPPAPEYVEGAEIAIVDTGNDTVDTFGSRLTGLGYTVTTIPLSSEYDTFIMYDAVLLPVSHASSCCNALLTSLAQDYIDYVFDGGCLYVGQPNPYDIGQDGTSEIPWVPYGLTVNAFYESGDCPPVIVDPDHCMGEGLNGSDLPFPGDTVLDMAADWEVVTEGNLTAAPGLIAAAHGSGNVLVEFAHPASGALCPYSDAGLGQMVECCLGPAEPTATESTTWGKIKTLHR
ncbi:MAG: hypothetical protein GF355_02225 [Candidatus Eisenbacteria bacterium]|nr:hypothetical protein [Candidatus Eisenbacteria bacterium]